MNFHLIHEVHAASVLPDFTQAKDFGLFIKYTYEFAIGIVGLAVMIQFMRAGFEYMLAAGSIGKTESAKEHMTNAVLGAVLLLSAYLILNTINPAFLDFSFFSKDNLVQELKKTTAPAPASGGTNPNSPLNPPAQDPFTPPNVGGGDPGCKPPLICP